MNCLTLGILISSNGYLVDYAKTILILGAICILALLAVKVGLPRLRGWASKPSGPIRLVATFALEPRKSLYLVKVGTRTLLLGASTDSIHFLMALEPGELEDLPNALSGAADASPLERMARTPHEDKQV